MHDDGTAQDPGVWYKWQARWSWSPVTASSSWRDLWWTLDLDTAQRKTTNCAGR